LARITSAHALHDAGDLSGDRETPPARGGVEAEAAWSANGICGRSNGGGGRMISDRSILRSLCDMPQLACSTDFVMDAFLAVALFAGCAVGPDYHRPAALGGDAMPAAFGDGAVTNAGHWKTAEPSAHRPRGVWWA